MDRATRTRISRSIITALVLTFIQTFAAPIVAPILAAPSAQAADANPFPSGLTGVIRYVADSYTAGASTWSDINGANPIAIAGTAATKVVNTAGTLGASSSVTAVQGTYATTMLFPTTVTADSNYTFFYIARYAPQQAGYTNTTSCSDTTAHGVGGADKRNRIFSGNSGNWLSGFWACAAGVAYHEGWVTQLTNSITELSGTAGNNWLLGADCGYTVASTSTCKGRYRAFGKDQTATPSTDTTAHRIAINQGGFPGENSDFQIAEVIALPSILQTSDVIRVETYLSRAYGIPLSANAATKLGLYTASVGSTLGQTFTTQPQIAIQDANGQTVTSDNTTIITATITGTNGTLLGTRTATAIRGVATFADLAVTGTQGVSYTITYTSNTSLTSTAETRSFTRAARTMVLALSKSTAAYGETATASVTTTPSSNSDGTLTYSAGSSTGCTVNGSTGVVTISRPTGTCSIAATIAPGNTYDTATATAVNLTVSTPGGETDTALSLNGSNQYAWAADNSTFDITTNLTLEAWVYPTEKTAGVLYIVATKSEAIQLFHMDGNWSYALKGSATWGVGIETLVPVRINEWHHIAITRAAGANVVNFYYDGALAYTGTANSAATGTISNNAFPFVVGAKSSDGTTFNYPFKGRIDQVALFNSERTAAQVASDMQGYISTATSGLAALYDFNEGSGSTLFNRTAASTSATDLTILNSPSFIDVKSVASTNGYTTTTFPRTYLTAIGGYRMPAVTTSASALIVAGGGAGGARVSTGAGGGGGAGGMVEALNKSYSPNAILTIKVGQGGFGTRTGTMSTIATGDNGGNSLLAWSGASTDSFTAIGGGGGAGGYTTDTNSYNGSAGGSGGGASGSNISGYLGGASLQSSGSGYTGYGNSGGANPGCPNNRPGGGGGGAGAVGESSLVCTQSGKGGDGRTSVVTGLTYAGGGGAGTSGDNGGTTVTAGAGGTGGGAAGGAGNLVVYVGGNELIGNFATVNTGGGGGGVGISTGVIRGGGGGSGIIVIRFLSSSKPIFTQPAIDTTTAGLTYTFTVTGDAPSTFFRSYIWQSSSDTGTTWLAINVGSGWLTASYTTPILETTTSGSKFQYRVIVMDTDTAGSSNLDTSTAVYLIINPRIAIIGSYTTYKYGIAHTDTFTVNAATGTGVKTVKRTSSAKTGITWDTSTANIARVSIAANLVAGTYYDTLTVTDEETATTILPITITVLKADTATVIVASRIDTYTASSLSYTDTLTVTGLVAGDSLTAVTYFYSGTANDGTPFNLAARPAIAGTYTIIPDYTLINASSYESVTVTYGQLTINRALRTVSISARPSSLKYGETSTAITTSYNGSGDGALSYLTSTPSNCAFTGLVLQAIEASGSCTFAARISRGNNYETGTSTDTSTSLTLADTITVTVQTLNAITYTGTSAIFTPRISVAGLVYTDTTTSTSATFTFKSATAGGSFSTTYPTNSDTYTVRADTLTVTMGLLSRYRNVIYVDGSIRINRAQQSPLIIPQYVATFGTPYRVLILGGSGTGAFTETVSAGTASGCVISGDTVTTTTQGTCLLSATRAQDQNYETATVSGYIYFLIWSVAPTPTIGSGTVIALNSEVSITRDPNAAPYISSVYASGDATYPVAIAGSGFTATAASDLTVKFWRNQIVTSADFSVVSDTLIITKQPAGATVGRVVVTDSNGVGASPTSFTPLLITG